MQSQLPWNMNRLIGTHNVLFITLDTLRYDVAQRAFTERRLPFFESILPKTGWQRRHTPGNFTYAAHHAFFAGFLPTPAEPGLHPRLFAAAFQGSETTSSFTKVFEQATLIEGLRAVGYRTICIGGVGFFNKQTALGCVLPGMFDESYWEPTFGVTCPDSTRHQVAKASQLLAHIEPNQRLLLFINVSAIHQPNYFYLHEAQTDSVHSQQAALEYVDHELVSLFVQMKQLGPMIAIVCSDHGTAYGEDGFHGHRLNHPVVGEVPYLEYVWPAKEPEC